MLIGAGHIAADVDVQRDEVRDRERTENDERLRAGEADRSAIGLGDEKEGEQHDERQQVARL